MAGDDGHSGFSGWSTRSRCSDPDDVVVAEGGQKTSEGVQKSSDDDAQDDEEVAEEDQDEAVIDGMGGAESDVADLLSNMKNKHHKGDLPIIKKNKRHKISPSRTREKGNGLGEGEDSGHEESSERHREESSEEEYVGSDNDSFGF